MPIEPDELTGLLLYLHGRAFRRAVLAEELYERAGIAGVDDVREILDALSGVRQERLEDLVLARTAVRSLAGLSARTDRDLSSLLVALIG